MVKRMNIQTIPDRRVTTVGGLDGLIREHVGDEDTLVSLTIINSLFEEDFILEHMKVLGKPLKRKPRAVKIVDSKRLVKAGLRGYSLVQGVYMVFV